MNISKIRAAINELPLRKQWAILKSIEHPKHRGYLSAVFMAGLSAFYQPLAGLRIEFLTVCIWKKLIRNNLKSQEPI